MRVLGEKKGEDKERTSRGQGEEAVKGETPPKGGPATAADDVTGHQRIPFHPFSCFIK